MSIAGKNIIIAGGGLGGLCAAIALEKLCQEKNLAPPTIHLFERDGSPEDKEYQDYSMSIRGDSFSGGIQVLQRLGIAGEALKNQSDSEGFIWGTHNGKTFNVLLDIHRDRNGPPQSLRTSRVALWKTILNSLPKSINVHWGSSCVNAKIVDDGTQSKVHVTLATGETQIADLLIVADGSASTLRSVLLPNEKLRFANACHIIGTTKLDRDIPAPFRNRHGVITGDGVGLFFAHEHDTTVLWSVSWLVDQPHETIRYRTATKEQIAALREEALDKAKQFPPIIREFISKADSLRISNCYDKPPHASLGQIVFLGDSVHPVTPFSGNGANMAFIDALRLAEQLTNEKNQSITEAVKEYDKEMIPRTTRVINQGRTTISAIHLRGYVAPFIRNSILWTVGFVIAHPRIVKGIGAALILGISALTARFFGILQFKLIK